MGTSETETQVTPLLQLKSKRNKFQWLWSSLTVLLVPRLEAFQYWFTIQVPYCSLW